MSESLYCGRKYRTFNVVDDFNREALAIERFFRTLKYDDIYVRDYNSISELRAGIVRLMNYYNNERLHSALGYKRPMDVYMNQVRIAA